MEKKQSIRNKYGETQTNEVINEESSPLGLRGKCVLFPLLQILFLE